MSLPHPEFLASPFPVLANLFDQLAAIHLLDQLARYGLVFTGSMVLSLILTPAMIRLAPRFRLIDQPGERRIHQTPIPRAGGVAVFLATHLGILGSFLLVWQDLPGNLDWSWWLAFLTATFVLCLTGLIDDSVGMRPLVKLFGQFAAANVFFFLAGASIGSLVGFDLPLWLDWALTISWCLALINAFNLIDGLDGLCGGIAFISAAGLAISFVFRGMSGDALILFALMGAILGFLRYNFNPARIFLGDTGSMFLGFSLAAISLDAGGKSTLVVSLGMPLVAAGVPLMDTLLAIWRRSARKILMRSRGVQAASKIMGADREHLHHRLLDMGFTHRRVAFTLYAANAFLVTLGLISLFQNKVALALLLVGLLAGVYILIRHVITIELWDTGQIILGGIRRPRRRTIASLTYPILDLLGMLVCHALAYSLIRWMGDDRITAGGILRSSPFWLTPIFCAMVFARVYSRVWSHANFRDFMSLSFGFYAGLLVGYCIAIFMRGAVVLDDFLQVCLFGFFAQFALLGTRTINHTFREWLLTAVYEEKGGKRDRKNILLYGAGDRGALYLRDYRMVHPEKIEKIRVLGFVDDDETLRNRIIHGSYVLGTGRDISKIAEAHRIDEIVITCRLADESADQLMDVCQAQHIRLTVWDRREREVALFSENPDDDAQSDEVDADDASQENPAQSQASSS